MIKTLSTNTVNPSLIALKPRQILLAESNMSHIKKKEKKTNDDDSRLADKTLIVSLKEDQKALLLHSIAHYLQRSGFSKAFKKFCSEAQIEKDNLNGASPALEEMCCKYLEMCDNAGKSGKSFNSLKEQGIGEADSVDDVETVGKKEKKTSKYCDGNGIVNQSGAVDKFTNSKNMLSNDALPEMKVKSKDKKKSKKILETPGQGAEQVTSEALKDPAHNTVCEIQFDEPDKSCKDDKKKKSKLVSGIHVDAVKNYQEMLSEGKIINDSELQNKSKDRKKKKTKPTSDTLVDNAEQCSLGDKQGARTINLKDMGCAKDSQGGISEELDIVNSNRIDSLKEDFKTLGEDAPKKEIKDSKKRKRLASKENNSQLVDSKEIEESKTEGSEESKGSKKQKVIASIGSDEHSGKESKVESGEVGLDDSQMALIKQVDGQGNGSLEKSVEKSSIKKSTKKQNNGSVEPKTVNAFQRVKVDDVVFTDDRLQDNSYWAKDGADAGYGAKAQEILGQVRGRDFRHEKTKKKRGTYRGGQIDLQSHSIKFNYSDDE